ncbi:MAG: FAD-dependent oxidoreductase [Acidobacteriota bacterium]
MSSNTLEAKVAIVGGGLTGLSLAEHLHRRGIDWCLLEARDRLGGRISGERVVGNGGDEVFDLGPSWFWPGQPRMHALVERLELEVFPQHAQGDGLFEDERGAQMKGPGFATMRGSLRVRGGMTALVDGVSARLPDERLHLGQTVQCIQNASANGLSVQGSEERPIAVAEHVILALPPRVAAGLTLRPALSEAARRSLLEIPSWMAGQAKFVAVYEEAFWRDQGLSGDAMSRRGPLAEIHDASLPGGSSALFGFVGWPPDVRLGDPEGLVAAAVDQLARLFGENARSTVRTLLKDWAADAETAVPEDSAPLHGHPAYGMQRSLEGLWNGTLHFAATELAPRCGGYLEGALESADETAQQLLARLSAERRQETAVDRDP